jgi:hypothetical protein
LTKADPMGSFELLNRAYLDFDDMLTNHRAIKVEHVGRDYMAVSPIFPTVVAAGGGETGGNGADGRGEDDDADGSCKSMAQLGLRMLQTGREILAGSGIELRVGFAEGPVPAAVIGSSRRFLRVLCDTVNTAARMCALAGPWEARFTADVATTLV